MAIRSVALAGMVSDTSLYNIDGACVVGGIAAIPVGVAVGVTEAQTVDGHKVVALGATAANVLGVVVRSHYETPDGTARAQEAVNVMTHGRIWMRTADAAAPTFGAEVTVTAATGFAAATGGIATGWTFAGGFIAAASNPEGVALVEVQVKQK